jgi:hypothetical protein
MKDKLKSHFIEKLPFQRLIIMLLRVFKVQKLFILPTNFYYVCGMFFKIKNIIQFGPCDGEVFLILGRN